MKSDSWLLGRIIAESLNKKDVGYMRRLIQEGRSDEELLSGLRKRMFTNSKGMLSYIRQEKIRSLMLKLSYRIHWLYLLPVIKKWLREKELLIRWEENRHGDKIHKKTEELKEKLLDEKYKKIKFDLINTGEIPEDVMALLEKAAEEILLEIEDEEFLRIR
ncbi:MAG: hypothetical protein AB1638_08730 [Nitrospirota bacterium]